MAAQTTPPAAAHTAAATALLTAAPTRGVTPAALAAVLDATTPRRLAAGERLCEEGEPAEQMWFLLRGAVKVLRRDPAGAERELARVEAPALVGHMAIIDGSPRSAACAADGDVELAALDRRAWNSLLTEPSARGTALRRVVCASLTRQLVGANERVRDLIGADRRPARAAAADKGHVPAPRALTPSPSAPSAPDEVEDFEPSDSEVMRVAGVLNGWKIDQRSLSDAGKAQVVYDEDQRRNPRNRR